MSSNNQGARVDHSELRSILRDGVFGTDQRRADALAGFEQVKAAKVNALTRERDRLRGKLGEKHPRVRALSDKIREHRHAAGEAQAEIDYARTEPPGTRGGRWVLYGYARKTDGAPLSAVTVGITQEPSEEREPLATVKTDARGYFELWYAFPAEEPVEPAPPGEDEPDVPAEPAPDKPPEEEEDLAGKPSHGKVAAEREAVLEEPLGERLGVAPGYAGGGGGNLFYPYVEGHDGKRHYGDAVGLRPRNRGRNFRAFLLHEVESGPAHGRFLGNANTRQLHDLENPVSKHHVSWMREDFKVPFDSIEEARKMHYDYCAFCFGRDMSES
jgi:hypothetical protein